jgi:hypothetical protein
MKKNNAVEDFNDDFEEVSNKKSFETIYLRLSYAKNIGKVHVPKELFDIHSYTVNVKSYKSYTSNAPMNSSMGFSKEDFRSIAMWHLAAYLSSMSLLMETKEREKFIQTYQKRNGVETFPSDTDFVKKDQSNFMSFLSQRMSDLNRIIVQGAKNVYGSKSIKRVYRLGTGVSPTLSEDHFRGMSDLDLKKLGYYLLDNRSAKELIRKAGTKYRFADVFEVDGVIYRKIYKTPEIHVYMEDIPFWENMPFSELEDQEDLFVEGKLQLRKERLLNRYMKSSNKGKVKMLERLKRFLTKKNMEKELLLVKGMLSELV